MKEKTIKSTVTGVSLKDEWQQVKAMTKHFLMRFIKNDTLQLEDQRTELSIFGLTFLLIWGGYVASQTDKFQFITFSMTLTGLFAVFCWDNMYLDQRDFQNLLPLPVKNRTIYISKFLSVLVVVAGLSLGFSGLSVLVYTLGFVLQTGPTVLWVLYHGVVLFLTIFLANLFIFLLLAAIQAILLFLFKGNLLVRVSLTVQVALLFGLGSVFVWFPRLVDSHAALTNLSYPQHYYFPPLWFNGFYQTLLGQSEAIHGRDTLFALLGLMLPLAVYLVSLPLGLKRFLNSTAPVKRRKKETRAMKWLKTAFHRLFLKVPEQRAVFYFFVKTIKRIKQPKMHLALFMALPTGFTVSYILVEYKGKSTNGILSLEGSLMILPFLLYFLLAAALRTMVNHPLYTEANWIFKLNRQTDTRHYLTGIKKAMIFSLLLPLFLLLLGVYIHYWGIGRALIFSVYGLVNGILMLEFLFLHYNRIPFTSLSNPEGMHAKFTWPAFMILFIVYFALFNSVGSGLLRHPVNNVYFYTFIAAVFWGLEYYRRTRVDMELVFDDEPVPVLLSFNLS